MSKVSNWARDGSCRDEPVAVPLSIPHDDHHTKVTTAVPKEAPPSNYIPMEPHVLVAKLSRRFSDVAESGCIGMLSKRIGLRCALRTEDAFSTADDLYSIFDPDSDAVTVDETNASRTKPNLHTLKADLDTVLEMAGFQPVPDDHITVSQRAGSLRGFRVEHPPAEALKIQMYYQRLLPAIIPKAHWLLPWRKEQVQVMQYGTLLACFQQFPAPPQPHWCIRLLRHLRRSTPMPSLEESPPHGSSAAQNDTGNRHEPPQPPVHLRVFRNVALHNADMLMPGAVACFTLLDQLFIWVPVLVGIGSAMYKIATSSLTFNPRADPVAFATTLALVLMPLSYALQARFSLQQKADTYKADIDELLLMRQRSSNAGALQWLLDTASEQEQKEMLLAYAFLWGGAPGPRVVGRETAKHNIDAAIERFLSDDIALAEGGRSQMAAIDFDMADALGDLIRVGLVREVGDGECLEVVPIREAVDIMSIRNYPEEAAEVPVAVVARQGASRWYRGTRAAATAKQGSEIGKKLAKEEAAGPQVEEEGEGSALISSNRSQYTPPLPPLNHKGEHGNPSHLTATAPLSGQGMGNKIMDVIR
eukprot:jgi/Ulvmu1/11723/UM008_0136.1